MSLHEEHISRWSRLPVFARPGTPGPLISTHVGRLNGAAMRTLTTFSCDLGAILQAVLLWSPPDPLQYSHIRMGAMRHVLESILQRRATTAEEQESAPVLNAASNFEEDFLQKSLQSARARAIGRFQRASKSLQGMAPQVGLEPACKRNDLQTTDRTESTWKAVEGHVN
jgi:hypothetical protein